MDNKSSNDHKDKICQIPFEYLVGNIDSDLFPYRTFFDFTKKEVMAKLFNGSFDFDYIFANNSTHKFPDKYYIYYIHFSLFHHYILYNH